MTALSQVHVLVADNNERMRLLVRCLLRAGGLTKISEAGTAADAFEIMQRRRVDLVIVEWTMHPVDGIAFTRMLRRGNSSPNPYVPILMLTSHAEASRIAAARDAGVTGVIKKPLSTRLLFDRVAGALNDARPFIHSADFFGPDRRRGTPADYAGPFRRATDPEAMQTIDLDDLRVA